MNKTLSFHPAVSQWFNSRFSEPSPPQVQGWPVITAGKHTLILAPTGSGKTLAAFLWCIDELFRMGLETGGDTFARNPDGVHTLYISPLKALNNDIHRNLQEPLKGIRRTAREMQLEPPDIRILVRTGDTPPHIRQSMLKKPPHILITTPESLYLLLTSKRGREMFRNLRYLIVDEIHALSNNKRGVHLSLSLERLMVLCRSEPVRIGLSATQRPLARIAAFLGGLRIDPVMNRPTSRPVTIVDCGQRKEMDLQVLSPVEDFGDLPEASVWPAVIDKLYQLIRAHRTTLVFVNMRAQAERVARQLNELHQKITEDPNAEIALAHHGSISREARYDIEATLKAGNIPAVIATASLELGIDIGSIDLVVQLESPRSITDALQRVGRSGHLIDATSKGKIIPLYPADLDDAVAIARCMLQGDIEETVIPENCLDVLAQQIVAEVSMREWSRPDLFRLVCQSYCYRNLTQAAFDSVLEMLSGRFADAPLPALQPRITWDKVNDRLIARRGAKLLAVMNPGTIPDRGYYGVYLAENNIKLGEMEEEFVFESKVGDVFYLGSNEWRIAEIKQDRIIVTAAHSTKPKPPFWKGDILYRDFSTQEKIAAFRGELIEQIDNNKSSTWLCSTCHADSATAENLQAYLNRQRSHTGVVATDRQLVAEFFRDTAGEPQLILHAPFGARVNGAWAIALAAAIEKRYRTQVQYDYDDDGIIVRIPDTSESQAIEQLLTLGPDEVERLFIDALSDTPLFSIYFRYNATRSLLLQRSRKGKRIPLWLQRLRAADVLQIVRQYRDFPIVLETYRECLQDVFDISALRHVIDRLNSGEISVHFVQTPYPSPMASGLLFRFLADHLYQYDQTRYPGQAAEFSSELLAEILTREQIPTIVSQELVAAAESRWQHLSDESKAAGREDLFAIIEQLGPIDREALSLRAKSDPAPWLKELIAENRIVKIAGDMSGWVSNADAAMFSERVFDLNEAENFKTEKGGFQLETMRFLLQRHLRTHGPVTLQELQSDLRLSQDHLKRLFTELEEDKEVVRGKLVAGIEEEQWCDRHNFAQLYRRAVAARRKAMAPVTRELFYRFLLSWHQFGRSEQSLLELIKCYSGFKFTPTFFEREILRSRFIVQEAGAMMALLEELNELISRGEVIVRASQDSEESRPMVEFFQRGGGNIFFTKSELFALADGLKEPAKTVFTFLRENGASLMQDIGGGTGLSSVQVDNVLATLVRSGLASCDNYQAFLLMLQQNSGAAKRGGERVSTLDEFSSWGSRGRFPRGRGAIQQKVQQRMQKHQGHWFLTTSFAVLGKEIQDAEGLEHQRIRNEQSRILQQTRLFLQRYGILVKEWYRRESGLLPWYPIFQTLKRLEWQGEVRRGYFVEGLSGVQFALPEATELLMNLQSETEQKTSTPILLSTADPGLPFGGTIDWNVCDKKGNKISVVRAPANHLIFLNERPAIYSENYGSRLWTLENFKDDAMESLADVLKIWLKLPPSLRPRKRIEITQVDGESAVTSRLADPLMRNGFESEENKLVLWPSGV